MPETPSNSAPDSSNGTIVEEDPVATLPYIIVGILGALIWDVFSNLGEDYELLRKTPIRAPTIVYFLSRIATLLCMSFATEFYTDTQVNCTALLRIVSWTFALGLSLTTLLFVFRVRAVYKNQKWLANFFVVMWLGVVAASLVATQQDKVAIRLEPSGQCTTVQELTTFIVATTVVPMANDVVIFCALTWKLAQNSHMELDMKKGLMVMIFGHYLPSFSRTLLRDGQAYFLTTAIVSTAAICLFSFAPATTSGISALLAFINIGIMHLMACKIYRKTRLGTHITEPHQESSLGPMEFRRNSIALSNIHNLALDLPIATKSDRRGNEEGAVGQVKFS